VLVLAAIAGGCAYFNTFYNAQQLYQQAVHLKAKAKQDKPSGAVITLLDRSIEKCTQVVRDHPRSKWATDAIFLMGNCYLEKQEYDRAIRKYEEIIEYYPESRWAKQALLSAATAYLAKGGYADAQAQFSRFLSLYPRDKSAPAAYLGKVESLFRAAEFDQVVTETRLFLVQFPSSPLVPEVRLLAARARMEQGSYQQAMEDLRPIVATRLIPGSLFVMASTLLGECLEAAGQHREALRVYEQILEQETDPERWRAVELKLGLTLIRLGEYGEAKKHLEAIPMRYPRTAEAAEGYYRLGLLYRDQGDLERAAELLQKARTESPGSKASAEALKEISDLSRLKEYREKLAGGQDPDELARAQFALAELYLFKLNEVDSALASYARVTTAFPRSLLAARAEFAQAWVLENVRGDSAAARTAYAKLIADYPDTKYAERARRTLGLSGEEIAGEIAPKASPDSAYRDTSRVPPPSDPQSSPPEHP
jgi:TolA-binding protein